MSNSTLSAAYLAEDRGPTILANNAIVTGIAAVVVLARVTSRFSILKRLGMDDWTIVLATILAVGNIVVASQSIRLGTGKHAKAIPTKNAIPAGIYRFVTRVVYFLITGTIKLSVCFLYLRVFPTIRKHTLILMAVIVSATIAQEFSTIFQCVPVAAVWEPLVFPHSVCINNVAFSYAASSISVVTDIWALVLPIPTVWSLQISKEKKFTLIGLFSIGMFACVAGVIRMAFLLTLLTSTDPTWDTYGTSIASGWETALAIITASIPGLKPMFDRIFPKIFPTTKAGSSATNQRGYEMGPSRRTKGFETLGTNKDGDSESTTAIKVNFEYQVRSGVESGGYKGEEEGGRRRDYTS